MGHDGDIVDLLVQIGIFATFVIFAIGALVWKRERDKEAKKRSEEMEKPDKVRQDGQL
ncbi:MAG: hypothetical protein ACYTEL_16155 [Planctomycetota bacterium]